MISGFLKRFIPGAGTTARPTFLIIGNGRSGSTWLLTSLDRLEGVTARKELKWWYDGQDIDDDCHVAIRAGGRMAQALRQTAPGAHGGVIGSKLIFDPYVWYAPAQFAALARTIEPGLKLILLKRGYLDIWLSWKARGVYHALNEAAPQPADDTMLRAIRRMEKPGTRHLVLHRDGRTLAPDRDGLAYPLDLAADDLLQFYANDMQALALVRKRGGLVVSYDEIEHRLPDIAHFIGAHSRPGDLDAIVGTPTTQKLEGLRDHVHPLDVLSELAGALDHAFRRAADGETAIDAAWRWDGHGPARIGDRATRDVFARHGLGAADADVTWTPLRPVV